MVQHPAGEIHYRKVTNVIIQSVDGKIPPPDIFFQSPENIVPQQPAVFMHHLLIGFLGFRTTKGCYFDNFPAKKHMRQPETPTDDATVAENLFDLLGAGVGRYIEILGFPTQQ